MQLNIKEQQILQYAMEHGIIDLTDVSADVEKMKKQEILKKYHYWQGSDGRFYFKYRDSESGRKKKISRASEEAIQEVILKFHAETAEKHTLVTVFDEWMNDKISCGELQESSIIKYKNNAKRFFAVDEDFSNADVKTMNDDVMESYVKKVIYTLGLTAKGYSDFRTIFKGTLKYAKRKKYTAYSIASFFLDFVPGKNAFSRAAKQESDISCFKKSELKRLKNKLLENGGIRDLALLLQMHTGIRVGELTALKSCDNIARNKLLIRRTESGGIDPETNLRTITIKETSKTAAGDREMILTTECQNIIDILKKINFGAEYLISENGKRLTSKQINYHLQKVCKEAGIHPRSTHKLRRSYASMLLEAGIDTAIVTNQLGHTEIATTEKYYHYDIEDDTEKIQKINDTIAI